MHAMTRLTVTLFGVSTLGLLLCQGCSDNSGAPCSDCIAISGHFSSVTAVNSRSALGERAASAQSLDASSVSMVLVFDTDGNYRTAAVTNGSFSIPVSSTTPTGMIFVGSTQNFLGYLTLGNGIDSLPMTDIADGVTEIDLQALSASGTIVTPEHNPLGTELPLSSSDQAAFAQCNALFASVVQNPDIDGNGVIDILEDHFYSTQVVYYAEPIHFNGALTPTIGSSVEIASSRLGLLTWDTSDDEATVTGPPGSGITNVNCEVWNSGGTLTYWDVSDLEMGSPTAIPVGGEYVFSTKNGKTLTATIPDQSNIASAIVVAIPTVTVSNGKISRVSWTYGMPNSEVALSPCTIIDGVMVQIFSNGAQITNPAPEPCTTTSVDVSALNIPWDDTASISTAYNDVFGNQYVVGFRNNQGP